MKGSLIVIPALNPNELLLDYVRDLNKAGAKDILVVDDGSSEEFQPIFSELEASTECKIFRHAKNLGKGRALKNAFNYYLTLCEVNNFNGIITADSDGQHRVEDVLKMVDKMNECPHSLILGCRDFDSDNVPPKSKFGNKLTKFVFKLLYGTSITDTQTGLRGFPNSIIPLMLDIDGERFEYETKMLIEVIDHKVPIDEVTIETIYFDNNAETHFNPIKDSIRIYKVIFASFFKFVLSSVSSFILDIGLFQLMLTLLLSMGLERGAVLIGVATTIARIFSSYYNFTVNKNIVFNGEKRIKNTIHKYYALAIVQLALSATLVFAIWNMTNMSETVIKIFVDTVLFLISYQIQRKWVFRNEDI